MARGPKHVVQTVGDFVATFYHPLILAGAQITIKGFKLEDTFLSTAQSTPNTKRVALVNGDNIALTNALKFGTITFNCLHVSEDVDLTNGDLLTIAELLQGAVDNIGGIINISYGFKGTTVGVTFYDVRLVSCPPILMAGNDIPAYPVVFSYGTFTRY